MRSFNYNNYAFLTLSLRLHERHLMVELKIILKLAGLLQIAEKRNADTFRCIEVKRFWNQPQKLKKYNLFCVAINELKLQLNAPLQANIVVF